MVLEDYDGAAVLVHTVRKNLDLVQFGLVALFRLDTEKYFSSTLAEKLNIILQFTRPN